MYVTAAGTPRSPPCCHTQKTSLSASLVSSTCNRPNLLSWKHTQMYVTAAGKPPSSRRSRPVFSAALTCCHGKWQLYVTAAGAPRCPSHSCPVLATALTCCHGNTPRCTWQLQEYLTLSPDLLSWKHTEMNNPYPWPTHPTMVHTLKHRAYPWAGYKLKDQAHISLVLVAAMWLSVPVPIRPTIVYTLRDDAQPTAGYRLKDQAISFWCWWRPRDCQSATELYTP